MRRKTTFVVLHFKFYILHFTFTLLVYTRFQLLKKYLHYYFAASNGRGHGIHSPFVFDFITTVLNDRQSYPAYGQVEDLRSRLQKDPTLLHVQDFGAGSVSGSSRQRSIAAITANAAKPKKYGQLLYRMVKKYQPATILELGTSLGITTAYLSLGAPEARLITMEGSPEIAAAAKRNFEGLQLSSPELVEGNFDETLAPVLAGLPLIDFVFVDGNHRREPTERYFEQLLPHCGDQTILIFDDIHWSQEMEEAWATICSHQRVRCTIDLFFIGIVLLRPEFREPQHFAIRF